MSARAQCLRGVLATLAWIGVAAAESPAPPPGFTPLFNGRDLAG